jgi:hypothetical protein
MAQPRPAAWGSVLRSALLFTPFFVASLAIFLFMLNDARGGDWSAGVIIGLVVTGGTALLLGFQSVQAVRDLFASLVETQGRVVRRWSRNEFFVMRNDYVLVERTVFRIEPERALQIEAGDTVRITHFPHTSTVEDIEVIQRGAHVEQ